MGTTLLWVETPFGSILYHLGKLYTDSQLSYFMHLVGLNRDDLSASLLSSIITD